MADTAASTWDAQITWPLRPVMTSLNGDHSWLFSFPRPLSDNGGKFYYHIVFEPWLNGPTNMFNDWLVHIMLPKPAQVSDIETLNDVALEIEKLAGNVAETNGVVRTLSEAETDSESRYNGPIDAILLFFHYIDHCHEPTLRLFDKRIPVIASAEAKAIIEKWGHFDTISLIPSLDGSASTWQSSDLHPDALPPWLTAIKFPGHHELNFAAALIWTHQSEDGTKTHEAILESPHGTRLNEGPLQAFLTAEPPIKKLALMHGLNESWQVGMGTNTYGAKGGLALYRKIGGLKYWVLTHSSDLKYSGLILRLLRVQGTPRTLDWALEQEVSSEGGGECDRPNLVKVENGGRVVLV